MLFFHTSCIFSSCTFHVPPANFNGGGSCWGGSVAHMDTPFSRYDKKPSTRVPSLRSKMHSKERKVRIRDRIKMLTR